MNMGAIRDDLPYWPVQPWPLYLSAFLVIPVQIPASKHPYITLCLVTATQLKSALSSNWVNAMYHSKCFHVTF